MVAVQHVVHVASSQCYRVEIHNPHSHNLHLYCVTDSSFMLILTWSCTYICKSGQWVKTTCAVILVK